MNEMPQQFKDEPIEEFGVMADAPENQPLDPLMGIEPGKSKKSLNSTIILLVVIGIGAVVIYVFGLRHQPKPPTEQAKALDAQLDQALVKITGSTAMAKTPDRFYDTEAIIKTFHDYPGTHQVEADELRRNPFRFFRQQPDPETVDQDRTSAKNAQETFLARELNNKVKQLQLESVLLSEKGSRCRINGEVFNAGEKIMDTFIVEQIQADEVTLLANDLEFVLRM